MWCIRYAYSLCRAITTRHQRLGQQSGLVRCLLLFVIFVWILVHAHKETRRVAIKSAKNTGNSQMQFVQRPKEIPKLVEDTDFDRQDDNLEPDTRNIHDGHRNEIPKNDPKKIPKLVKDTDFDRNKTPNNGPKKIPKLINDTDFDRQNDNPKPGTKNIDDGDRNEIPKNDPIGDVRSGNSTHAPGLMLLWMPFFSDPNWYLGDELGSVPFEKKQCPHTNCQVTADRKALSKADMVLFHCVDKLDYWPKTRTPNQVYAGYCWEAPMHYGLGLFDNQINMTITYRLDSDFVDRAGRFTKRSNAIAGKYVPRIPFSEKTSDIVWTVSHCPTVSKREDYVKNFTEYMSVDKYGSCGNLTCSKSDYDGCFESFEKKYKFFLAFENNICLDYVTEKFFRPLAYELIPVVMGGGNYKRIAPPHSYINVEDFRSPQDLARYLKYVAGNETAYNEYFQWKQSYVSDGPDLWCEFCRYLNIIKEGGFHKEARDINTWWTTDACRNDLVPRLLS